MTNIYFLCLVYKYIIEFFKTIFYINYHFSNGKQIENLLENKYLLKQTENLLGNKCLLKQINNLLENKCLLKQMGNLFYLKLSVRRCHK